MSRIVIPALLVATIMVAGAFAFVPVDQASTVHDTLRTGTSSTVVGGPFLTTALATNIFGTNDDGIDISDADTITFEITVNSVAIPGDDCDLAMTVTDATNDVDFGNGDVLFPDALIYDASGEVDVAAGDTILAQVDISGGNYQTIDVAIDFEDGTGGTCDINSDWNVTLRVLKKGPSL